MRLGITGKLFFALLLTSVAVAAAVGIATRLAFTSGFREYVNEREEQRATRLADVLGSAYRQHGDWTFLRDESEWRALTRPAGGRGRTAPGEGALPPREKGAGPAVGPFAGPPPGDPPARGAPSLLDVEHRLVAGPSPQGEHISTWPVNVDGATVGWVAMEARGGAFAGADLRFQREQMRSAWIIGGLALALAAAAALLLSRGLVAPLKRLAAATHRLAAGEYATRIERSSRDEVGALVEDFNRLAVSLQRNEQIRRAFMADVSHELRTPLAVLRAELDAVADGIRPVSSEAIASFQAEVALLEKLVDDIYQLSLADAGALNYRLERIDLTNLLATALRAFAERLDQRRITLEAALSDSTRFVQADANRLIQVFNNLLENTVRYTDEGGCLKVALTGEGDRVQIDFQDSAPGVPEEALPRLFDRFFRVEKSRSRELGGAGLGLSLCQRIVQAHHGDISLRASPLGGLWVRISLPLEAH